MKKIIFLLTLTLVIQQNLLAQCNQGLNLGAVIVPTHGDSANGGNFFSVPAWQEAANWLDTFNLDYRQRYLTWTDVVQQITGGVPTYNSYQGFENGLTMWSGNVNVHVVYPVIKVELPNTTMAEPPGFISSVDSTNVSYFSDTAFVNQNYLAIKHILQNVNNVKWISVGNEIDTYFKNAYWGTGRLTRYGAFLDTIRTRMNADGFSYVKLGSVVAFHNLTWSGNYDIIDSIRPHVDFVGYTFYYTSLGSPNDTCWGNPATVTSWLNIAKTEVGSKKMLLTETCMGDGGGISQNCGSPSKQLAYADTLLSWYNSDTSKIIGMTWFTVVDPYLGWQTPSTLWNTCGLVDSNGVTVQSAGTLWRHDCMTTGSNEIYSKNKLAVFPNPFSTQTTLQATHFFQNTTLTIYNSFGQTVKQIDNLSGQSIIFHRDNLVNGLYFVQLTQDNKIITTTKLVITD
ncbi:MAG: T9SS type A sorting domain-containing protein [Bacteroidetes bacterium]|nr:T9SS type A sorting domain-containing protein [Bacteroidota bacterium]